MVVSAEKARAKAEARRARILSKSAERLDVVSGLAPDSKAEKSDVAAVVDNGDNEPVIDDGGVDGVGVDGEGADKANDNENNNKEAAAATTTAAENDNTPSSSSNKGARRMAAMRRRRYQAKKKEEENDIDATAEGAGEEKKGADVEKTDGDNKTATEEEPTLIQDALEEKDTNEKDNEENDDDEEEEATGEGETKKKYMGVARMRRKIIKEQKAQRIAELEAAVSSESGGNDGSSDAIDAAATMAAMGMTASMIRKGSSSAEGDLSDVAIKTLQKKKKKKSWWKLIFPPMSLVPRLVTLTLLFMAGLDVGLEPHRMMTTNTSSSSMLSAIDNNAAASGAAGGVHLIYHVESSLTKPWEYGMGGKARHMMGMMETAPPTSLPTSFTRKEEFCIDGGKECDAKEGVSTSKEKEMEMKEKLLSGDEEEEDNSLLPKGVSASEFDDDDDDMGDGKDTFSPPVIDPIFRVDLDDLLRNSQLPAPINFCAKFAIGFHRMWVRYLWTIPTSVVTSVLYSPKTLIDSWMANPPIFLFISLLIRMIVRLLLGNASSLSDEEDEDGGGGGKKKDNLDVLGKIKDTALNYATSSFPKTILVLKTLKEVVTVDMYVILCGLLVGLVVPLVKEDLGLGKSGGGHVLGDGEL